ncbi:MAG TPA: AAA family ATPase [Armatimonadota bacterium]|nr:AAA family ATPase [Armatimonadota bacterium]
MRFFNTTGPVNPEDHYCLDPLSRWNLSEILNLIGQKRYFVLHAPRQTGKTSCLLALVDLLNREGQYRAVYTNVENGQSARENVGEAMRAIISALAGFAQSMLNDSFIAGRMDELLGRSGPHDALHSILSSWAASSPKPLVLMIDEADALVGDTLISLLRQLRTGYPFRPARFPQTVILCGVRDVRDYRIHSSTEKAIITGGSAFNIKAESLRLGDFSRTEMEQLYRQHTSETGQVFLPEALDMAWNLTSGQPWVVNALAYETCFRMTEGRDRSLPITAEMMEQAGENLILRRETHLDQLADKLKEDRVRRVIEPLVAGEELSEAATEDDVQYVIDLGLVRRDRSGLRIANGLYQEVIPRQLTFMPQLTLENLVDQAWFVGPDGQLLITKLLESFQEFFRENSEHWSGRFSYQEAWPQLLLQAYLQRVVNGGGQVHREYGLGRGRTDLLVVWPRPDRSGNQKVVIELKVRRTRPLDRVIAEGLEQTASYLDRSGTAEGHLLVFDLDPAKSWDQRIFRRQEYVGRHEITLWGM